MSQQEYEYEEQTPTQNLDFIQTVPFSDLPSYNEGWSNPYLTTQFYEPSGTSVLGDPSSYNGSTVVSNGAIPIPPAHSVTWPFSGSTERLPITGSQSFVSGSYDDSLATPLYESSWSFAGRGFDSYLPNTDDSVNSTSAVSPSSHLRYCTRCEKSFSRFSDLRKHEAYHNAEKQFSCSMCGQSFIYDKDLRRHKLSVHNIDTLSSGSGTAAKPFACLHQDCERTFWRKDKRNEHVRRVHAHIPIPEKTKELICDHPNCVRSEPFRSSYDLKRHKESIHPEACLQFPSMFYCPFDACSSNRRGFQRKDNLARHIRTQHGKVPAVENDEKFET